MRVFSSGPIAYLYPSSGKREFLKQLPDNLHRDRELEKGINYFVHVFAHNIVQSI